MIPVSVTILVEYNTRLSASHKLRAGPLSLEYHLGDLRYLRLNGVEVLRRISVAVRDRNWGTVETRISDETVAAGPESFAIGFTATHTSAEVDFVWSGTIRGNPNGAIHFRMDGAPRRSFLRNRIGICVLHGIEGCAGQPCIVEHSNGKIEQSRFPWLISPHQPFLHVRAIEHEVSPGVRARVSFSGDVFETEDQRNWSDQSFKTYSTPLNKPYPVEVTPADRIIQEVELTLSGLNQPEIIIDRSRYWALPEIGFCAPSARAAYQRIDVRFNESTWPNKLREAANIPVEYALFTDGRESELKAFTAAAPLGKTARYLIFSADGAVSTPLAVQTARRMLLSVAAIGGGSSTNFTELNRNRDAVPELDFLSWRIDPQVHASDELTLIENIEAQPETVASARAFAGSKPLRISPVLVPQFPGTAAWLTGSLSALAQSGIAGVTFSEPHPALDDILDFHAEHVVSCRSTLPLCAGALTLKRCGAIAVWLANFRGTSQSVRFEGRDFSLEPWQVLRIEPEASGDSAPGQS